MVKKFESYGIVKTKKTATRLAKNVKEYSSVKNTKVVKLKKPTKEGFKYRVLVRDK